MQRHDVTSEYVEHLHARVRSERGKSTSDDEEHDLARLPSAVAEFCRREPRECLNLILAVVGEQTIPEMIRAIGDGLLEDLLNESSAEIADEVSDALRKSKRFRQAFGFARSASVDPAIVNDWVRVFQEIGTTKAAERKSVWRT